MNYEYVGEELDVFALAVNWKAYFASLVSPFISGDVLEVGAGIGETTRALLNDRCSRWVCLEPDPRLAHRLRESNFSAHIRPEVTIGQLGMVKFEPNFSAILYIDVLEHIRDDRTELQRAARLLAPGGHLIVLSPAFQSLYSAFDRSIGHERRYTRSTLNAVFPRELEMVRSFYADAIGAALSFANAVLLKQSLPTRTQIKLWDSKVIPLSRVVDPLIGRSFGRSVIAVYRKPN